MKSGADWRLNFCSRFAFVFARCNWNDEATLERERERDVQNWSTLHQIKTRRFVAWPQHQNGGGGGGGGEPEKEEEEEEEEEERSCGYGRKGPVAIFRDSFCDSWTFLGILWRWQPSVDNSGSRFTCRRSRHLPVFSGFTWPLFAPLQESRRCLGIIGYPSVEATALKPLWNRSETAPWTRKKRRRKSAVKGGVWRGWIARGPRPISRAPANFEQPRRINSHLISASIQHSETARATIIDWFPVGIADSWVIPADDRIHRLWPRWILQQSQRNNSSSSSNNNNNNWRRRERAKFCGPFVIWRTCANRQKNIKLIPKKKKPP